MPSEKRNNRYQSSRSYSESDREFGEFSYNSQNQRITNKYRYPSESGGKRYARTQFRRRRSTSRKKVQPGKAVTGAQNQLNKLRQGSLLAVALVGFLLMLFVPEEAGSMTESPFQINQKDEVTNVRQDIPDTVSIIEDVAVEELLVQEEATDTTQVEEDLGKAARNEALYTLQRLWEGFYSNLPKILVAICALLLAWILIRLIKLILRKTFKRRKKSEAIVTLVVICAWLFAIGLAISIVAGDIRALVGSLGLIGLALSWSLQTPIECFTGWLMNSFQGYYRVGDRISVGEVFGDVYKIDFFTTTVWEIGAPFRPGFVQAEQPTGRLVTFPNNEILTGTVINLTGDFPFVWDELAIAVGNESKIDEAMEVFERIASELLGDYMKEPSHQYYKNLQRAGLDYPVPDKPQVYISIGESWTDVIIRYLVGARERRKWKSDLSLRIIEEINKPNYVGRIKPVYPRQQVQFVNYDGMPIETIKVKKDKDEDTPV